MKLYNVIFNSIKKDDVTRNALTSAHINYL